MGRIFTFLFTSSIIGVFSACTAHNPYSHYNHQQASTGSSNPDNPYGNYPNGPPPNSPVSARDVDFPYELIPDTLTALTCPNHQTVNNKPFTLTLGAHLRHGHGLQLSRDFLRSNDITENTPYQRVRQLIERSPFKDARARLALHDESNLNAAFNNSQGRPIQDEFPIFNNSQTLDHLSRLRRVFASRSSSSRQVNRGGDFTASLPISGRFLISLAPGLAEQSYGEPLLALTYTLNRQHSIYNPDRLPYGRGYKLQFEDPHRANYLIDVQEEDLLTARRDGDWFCPEELSFMVHRATRRADSLFNRTRERFSDHVPAGTPDEGYCYTTGKQLNADEEHFFETVFGTSQRNSLPFEVGKTVVIRNGKETIISNQPCIKFKTSSCYAIGGFFRIEFDPNKLDDCILNRQIQFREPSNEEVYKICPAFLSVCYRDD